MSSENNDNYIVYCQHTGESMYEETLEDAIDTANYFEKTLKEIAKHDVVFPECNKIEILKVIERRIV